MRSLGTGTFTSGAAFGASLLGGPVGAAASVAIQLAALVQETIGPLIEKENQIQRELIMADVRRQLDERLEELAFDPGGNSLRQQRIRKAFADEARRDVAAGRDAAWSPVSARLSDL